MRQKLHTLLEAWFQVELQKRIPQLASQFPGRLLGKVPKLWDSAVRSVSNSLSTESSVRSRQMYALPVEFKKTEDAKGWELCLYVDRHFDYNVPFRPLLLFITESVRSQGIDADLLLPDYYLWEDFVEGTLKIRSFEIRVYFEYSLSYLSLMAEQREGLQMIEACTHGKVFLHEGNGLPDDVQG